MLKLNSSDSSDMDSGYLVVENQVINTVHSSCKDQYIISQILTGPKTTFSRHEITDFAFKLIDVVVRFFLAEARQFSRQALIEGAISIQSQLRRISNPLIISSLYNHDRSSFYSSQ